MEERNGFYGLLNKLFEKYGLLKIILSGIVIYFSYVVINNISDFDYFNYKSLKEIEEKRAELEVKDQELKAEAFAQGVAQATKTYETIRRFVRRFKADRLMVIEFHNDGSAPDGRNHGYVSVAYEWNEGDLKLIKGDYQKFRGYDYHYSKMIHQLVTDGHYTIKSVPQMPESFLKNVYMHQKMETVYLSKIKLIGKSTLYFFSVQWNRTFDTNTHNFKGAVPVFIGQLQSDIGLNDPKTIKIIMDKEK